jgi:hypothetical protein
MSQSPDAFSANPDGPPDEVHMDGLDDLVRPRLSRRARRSRAGLLLALVLAVAGGLVWRSAATEASANAPQDGSTRQASVLVTSNLSYGTVTVNGQKQSGSLPLIIQLRPGTNLVTLDATPFAPAPCLVNWPEGSTSVDTPQCGAGALSPSENVVVRGKLLTVAGKVNFSIDGASLPPAACMRALDAIARSLAALALITAVPAGQHIATGESSAAGVPFNRSAPAGLRARLASRVEDYADRRCDRLFADGSAFSGRDTAGSGRTWFVVVPIVEKLSFIGPAGKPAGLPIPSEGTIQVYLVVPSNSSSDWQLATVTPPLPTQIAANLCGGGSQVLAAVYHLTFPSVNGYSLSDLSAYSIEGCLLELSASADNWGTRAIYLWRFGVLMATDAASHNLLPMLPMASAAELAAVPKTS